MMGGLVQSSKLSVSLILTLCHLPLPSSLFNPLSTETASDSLVVQRASPAEKKRRCRQQWPLGKIEEEKERGMRGGARRVNKRPAETDHRLESAIERLSERGTTEDCARRAQQITSNSEATQTAYGYIMAAAVGVSVRLCGSCHLHSRLSSSSRLCHTLQQTSLCRNNSNKYS